MGRWLPVSALLLWAGSTLLLAELPWFRRPSLAARLRPYGPGGLRGGSAGLGPSSNLSPRALLGPLVSGIGGRLARAFGVQEDAALRLRRIHSPLDVTELRLRQLGWAGLALAGGAALAAALHPPLPLALLFLLGGPLLAFLAVEQRLATASDRWKGRVARELPVLAEQLGMLLGAGYSLGAAVQRLATRGSGACAQDLAVVCGRIRQGLSDVDALREWVAVADVAPLHRLVAVLALNREAGDLGRLIGEEARAIRRDAQRDLVQQIERRSQQVWIPVTVATLVPGALLLAVPFVEALRLFSSA